MRLLWLTALVGLSVYLYYQPLASYLETRNDLAGRQVEVERLRIAKAGLERRLVNSTSEEATQREARRIGYVLPGEQLFVVKGIPEWRRVQRSLREDG
ncbi:MAG: septum formation initiator family protein [Actinobacteria bacterium]|nr:septum formation initiator family protein [Actinomycetota bacterium]